MLTFNDFQKSVSYGDGAVRTDSTDAINYGLFWQRQNARWCNEKYDPQPGDLVRRNGELRSIGCVHPNEKFQLGQLSFHLYESGNLQGSGGFDLEGCLDMGLLAATRERAEQPCWIFSLGDTGPGRNVQGSISVRVWEYVSK